MHARLLVLVPALAGALLPAPAAGCDDGSSIVAEAVVASVGRFPVLASDVDLAALVALAGDGAGRDAVRRARVVLELEYRELASSGALGYLHVATDDVVAELVARAGGATALASALDERGLTTADLEALALRVAATRAWTEERLRPRVVVTRDQIEEAYEHELAPAVRAEGGVPPPLGEVEGRLRRLLEERGLNEQIERWLADIAPRWDIQPPLAAADGE